MEAIMAGLSTILLNIHLLGTIIGVALAEELSGVEGFIVPVLKFVLLAVMAGGAVAVFREIVPMARGRAVTPAAQPETEGETQ